MLSLPQTALTAIVMTGRHRPGRQRHHHGLLRHAFAISPWLGAILVVLIVIGGLALTLIRKAGRILDGTPWYIRLALLVTAGIGISRLIGRQRRPGPFGEPGDWRPGPPMD